jgi:hypothetical protein
MSKKAEEVTEDKKADKDLTPLLIETISKYVLASKEPVDATNDAVYLTWAYLKATLPRLERMINKGIKVDINMFRPK